MEIRLDGKRALVTGAGKGIGRAIAKQLITCGAETYALSRTQADLDSLRAEVPSINVVNLDLTKDWDKTREVITKIGPIDFLVNNAGIGTPVLFLSATESDLDTAININYKAVYNVSQVVAKGMVERGTGGVIINISSMTSRTAAYGSSIYSSTKASLDMLTKCMALELGPQNIRVNSVNPTVIWTDMTLKIVEEIKQTQWLERTPLGKFAELKDVANAVIFLLSDKSAMISGENIRIDGGLGVY